jgi:hypothetical protein
MSLAKIAQNISLDGTDVEMSEPLPLDTNMADDNMLFIKEDESDEDLFLVGDPNDELVIEDEPVDEIILTLDKIPGAMDQDDIVEEAELEVEEEEDIEVSDDPWALPSAPAMVIPWFSNHMQNCPRHSGRDTTGLERAIAHFERLNPYVSRAIRGDTKNEIDILALEKIRDEIHQALERLTERLDQIRSSKYRKGKKKKADETVDGLVKEGQRADNPRGLVITVPLFISSMARVLINGMVSGGHDIEDMFKKLDKKWKFDDREKAEIFQLLSDMHYPVRRDRGFMWDEEIDTQSVDNFDWAQNFHA